MKEEMLKEYVSSVLKEIEDIEVSEGMDVLLNGKVRQDWIDTQSGANMISAGKRPGRINEQ